MIHILDRQSKHITNIQYFQIRPTVAKAKLLTFLGLCVIVFYFTYLKYLLYNIRVINGPYVNRDKYLKPYLVKKIQKLKVYGNICILY